MSMPTPEQIYFILGLAMGLLGGAMAGLYIWKKSDEADNDDQTGKSAD